MEFAEVEPTVRQLAKSLANAQMAQEKAARMVAGLQKILSGYVEMYPELASIVEEATGVRLDGDEEDNRPRGAEAVRIVLQDAPGKWFRVSQLVGFLRERGWLPESENPANAVRAALERLAADEDSDVVRGKFKSGAVGYAYDPDRDRSEEEGFGYDEEPF